MAAAAAAAREYGARVTTTAASGAKAVGGGGTAGRLDRRGALLTLVLANILWAGTYTAGKVALRYLSPVELNAIRFSLAALMLSPVLLRGWRRLPRDRRAVLMLAFLTLLGFVLNKTFEYIGLSLSTASDVALLIATESIFTALLSWTLLRERVTAAGVSALVVGLLGVYLIIERGFAPNLGGGSGAARIVGDLLVVLSLLIEALYTVKGKSALAAVPPLLFTATTITGSLFVWLPAGAVAVAHSGWPHVPPQGWLAVLYMAAIATVAGYYLWFRGLTVVDGSAAAPLLFIQPLLGATLAILLLRDIVTWATLLGGALIGASLLLVMRGARSSTLAPPAPEPVP